eukprot:1512281-Lingulodinium_polyedra.AAC.1
MGRRFVNGFAEPRVLGACIALECSACTCRAVRLRGARSCRLHAFMGSSACAVDGSALEV